MAKRSLKTQKEIHDDLESEVESELEEEQEAETEREDSEEDEEEERREKRVMIRVVPRERFERKDLLQSRLVSFSTSSSVFNGGAAATAGAGNYLCCQADECGMDLRDAKQYHRRHKVCERHAKAAVVLVKGLRQRFCQQCSRFHEISEFDSTKRSCRDRLAGHNERRRKIQPDQQEEEVQQPLSKTNSCELKLTAHPKQGELALQRNRITKQFRIG